MNKQINNKRSGLFKAWNTRINRFCVITTYLSYLFLFYCIFYTFSIGGAKNGEDSIYSIS